MRAFRPRAAAVPAALAALLVSPPARALDGGKAITQYVYDRWRAETGLPYDSIQAVLQTRDGYVWLGTPEGLVRFDGVRFTLLDRVNTPGMRALSVQALLEGRDGSLWFSTGGGGLGRLQSGRLTFYTVREGLSSNLLGPLVEDPAGDLWIGSAGGGLNRLSHGAFTHLSLGVDIPQKTVHALWRDREGSLWMGTDGGGLIRLQGGALTTYTTAQGLPSNTVYAILGDREGTLWIGTNGGLTRWRNGVFTAQGAKEGFLGQRVESLLEDRDGNLWIGTYGAGLYRYRDGRFSRFAAKDGLSSDIVWALHEDAEGSLWIGTRGGGLGRLKDGRFTTVGVAEGLQNDLAWGLAEDHAGGLWIATDGGLSRLFEGRVTTLTTRDGLSHNMIRSVLEDRGGTLWVGTWGGGLNRMKDGRFRSFGLKDGLSHGIVRALLEDREGTLWVGTYGGGLDRFRDGTFTAYTTKEGLTNDYIYCLLQASDGVLWIGTRGGGLNRLEGGRFKALTTRDGLADDIVLSLYEDPERSLWIGTRGGLSRLRDGRLTTFTTKDGLLDDVVYRVLEDARGDFWMSSNRGVFRVSKTALADLADGKIASVAPEAYGKSDGLRSTECNGGVQSAGLRARDGRLLFPTVAGVVAVDPSSLAPNRRVPPVHIEQALADGRPIPPGDSAPPGARELQFVYTALSLLAPERVRFRYRLDGFDKGWIDAGTRRVAYYTNLPPGKYGFRVVACNDDGLWNEAGDLRELLVRPRWNQTWWFRTLFVVLVVLAGALGYALRVQGLKRRERALLALVEERTRDLEAANQQLRQAIRLKDEMVSMVAHDLRSPLTIIQGYAEMLEARTPDDESRGFLATIAAQAQNLAALAADTLTLSRIEAGALPLEVEPVCLQDLAAPLVASASHHPGTEVVLEAPPESVVVQGDPARLRQVLENLVGNAIKYSTGGARVRITIRRVEEGVQVSVQDRGLGIAPAELPRLFQKFSRLDRPRGRRIPGTGLGLYICRSIVGAHGGRIWAESEAGLGSTFHFVLPARPGAPLHPGSA